MEVILQQLYNIIDHESSLSIVISLGSRNSTRSYFHYKAQQVCPIYLLLMPHHIPCLEYGKKNLVHVFFYEIELIHSSCLLVLVNSNFSHDFSDQRTTPFDQVSIALLNNLLVSMGHTHRTYPVTI